MREIKFRGFGIFEWVYGSLVGDGDKLYIVEEIENHGGGTDLHATVWSEVSVESVGEYTGLHDKNNKEIYEGDIVEFNDFDSLRTGGHTEDNILQGGVSFSCGAWIIKTERGHYDLYTAIVNDEELEIIGNVHSNPELIQS